MATRAAIYLRISLDAATDGLAIERQREDCKAIAKQRGWTVVHTYVDQSISNDAIARLEAKIRSLPRGAVHIPVLAVENPAQHFLDADLNIQRHTIEVLATVRLWPQPRGRKGFDPASVDVDFGDQVAISVFVE